MKAIPILLITFGLLPPHSLLAGELPDLASVVSGLVEVTKSPDVMTIRQATERASINWTSFSIANGKTVNFIQPSSSSVALNTVLGSQPSNIFGSLNANGHVFLINPNGILFSPTAQVSTGGLIASTLNITKADFDKGNFQFSGGSTEAVVNEGNINTSAAGVAFIAAKISNSGTISSDNKGVLMGAGSDVTVDFGDSYKIRINKSVAESSIENAGSIIADGGLVYLTTQTKDYISSSVINNTGLIQAQTLATGEKGEIYLMGHMSQGDVLVGGVLDASAPKGGDGGFVETSAGNVDFNDEFYVNTISKYGVTGDWLIDPDTYTVASSGGDITGAALASSLSSSNISLLADTGISINDNVTWSSGYDLTLSSGGNISLNANLVSSGSGEVYIRWGQSSASGGAYSYTEAAGSSISSTNVAYQKGTNGARYAKWGQHIYLGGTYMELAIDGFTGDFVTVDGPASTATTRAGSGFYGRRVYDTGVGLISDADGFGVGYDLRLDYYEPGTPEERYYSGYKRSGTTVTTNGSCPSCSLTMLSSGDVLSARVTSNDGVLKIDQVITFGVDDNYYKDTVTMTNVDSTGPITDVRFARSMDPDQTRDYSGSFVTINSIENSFSAGDDLAAVSAVGTSTAAYFAGGAEVAPKITYFSRDSSAKASLKDGVTGPSWPLDERDGIYDSLLYDSAVSKGTTRTADAYISIAGDKGSIAAGESAEFVFYTSFSGVLSAEEMSDVVVAVAVAEAAAAAAKAAAAEAVATPKVSATPEVASLLYYTRKLPVRPERAEALLGASGDRVLFPKSSPVYSADGLFAFVESYGLVKNSPYNNRLFVVNGGVATPSAQSLWTSR